MKTTRNEINETPGTAMIVSSRNQADLSDAQVIDRSHGPEGGKTVRGLRWKWKASEKTSVDYPDQISRS